MKKVVLFTLVVLLLSACGVTFGKGNAPHQRVAMLYESSQKQDVDTFYNIMQFHENIRQSSTTEADLSEFMTDCVKPYMTTVVWKI